MFMERGEVELALEQLKGHPECKEEPVVETKSKGKK